LALRFYHFEQQQPLVTLQTFLKDALSTVVVMVMVMAAVVATLATALTRKII
jgi:hypothetical protein